MALKTVISSFPIFSPTTPSAATTTVIRFSRWNNANAEEFNVRRLNQESLELDIRRLRRFNSVVNITSNYSPPPSSPPQPPPYKSAGTPSSPSLSSIPGRKSKYSKPDYRNDRNAPGYSRPSRRNYGGEPRVAFRRVPVSETAGNGEETGDFRPNRRNYGNTSGGDAHVAGNGGETGDFRPNRRNYGNTPERGPRVVYRNIPLPGKTEIGGKSSQTKPNRLNGAHPAFRRLTRWTKLPRGETEENNVGETEVKVRDEGGGLSYVVPGAPFEFMYSYTEAPKGVKPVALREEAVAPFGPESMGRPWTGRKPLSKKLLAEMDSFKPPPPGKKGVKSVQRPGPYLPGTGPRYVMSREEILGEELTKEEVTDLIEGSRKAKRQLNMGRDGLTHNMLDNIHAHWKRRRVCKVKCKGVCTVDMDNVCEQLEEKTGGKIIYRRGGVLFLFRGRNYNFKTRPRFPLMLWKPITPVFPRLVQRVPEGLTLEEATAMRKRGRDLIPICKLGKNGVYVNLVKTVREAFEVCDLVRVNCQGLNPSDYRKIGAKLKDLVPCVLISFEYEHILIWRGKEWKPSLMLPEAVNKEYQVSESDRDAFLGPDTSPSDDEQESESESCSDIPNGKTCDEIRDLSEALTNDSNVGALGSEDEILDLSKALTNDSNVGALGSEDTFVVKDDEPSNVNGVIPNQTNTIGTKTLKSEVTSGSNNNSDNDVKSGACTDERESTNSASCQSSDSEGVMESFSRSSAVNAELQAMVENTPDSSHSSKASQCTEGVLLLLRQALDSGSAVTLDVTSLDADAIYEKSVAVARVAPPEPAFIHQTRKVVIRKSENQENGDVEMHEVVDEPVPEKKSSKKASKEKKKPTTQKKEDFKEDFLNIVPQGSLGIDELAKLLA